MLEAEPAFWTCLCLLLVLSSNIPSTQGMEFLRLWGRLARTCTSGHGASLAFRRSSFRFFRSLRDLTCRGYPLLSKMQRNSRLCCGRRAGQRSVLRRACRQGVTASTAILSSLSSASAWSLAPTRCQKRGVEKKASRLAMSLSGVGSMISGLAFRQGHPYICGSNMLCLAEV